MAQNDGSANVTKVVINSCFGGFSLSEAAILWLIERGSPLVKKTPVAEYYGFAESSNYRSKDEAKKEWEEAWEKRETFSRKHGLFKVGKLSIMKHITDGKDIWDVERSDAPEFRTHPDLVLMVQTLGGVADGDCAELEIIEIPADVQGWYIHEYDGNESIKEGRTWR